jgi:hypothetical protein
VLLGLIVHEGLCEMLENVRVPPFGFKYYIELQAYQRAETPRDHPKTKLCIDSTPSLEYPIVLRRIRKFLPIFSAHQAELNLDAV